MNLPAAERLGAETALSPRLDALESRKTNIHDVESAYAIQTTRSWGALFLAIIEAACLFLVAAAKAGALGGTILGALAGWSAFLHRDILRIPLLLSAIIGSVINVFLLWRAHRLRNVPAAAWRKRPLTTRERFRIGLVLSLSTLTFFIAGAEIYIHRIGHHSIM